jgi:NADPH:quinone reductase-like Zn-dependent oxidoreductase
VDGNIRAGLMQGPMPLTLPHLEVGDRVVGFLPFVENGAAAEYVLASAEGLAHAPESIPLAEAASVPIVGLTAYQALFIHAGLEAGQRILITGADGAVGGYAVQLAKAAGAHVIATASPRSRDQVTAKGADEIVDYTTADVTTAVTEPVDVLLNLAPIDPAVFAALAGRVRDGGVVVSTTVWMPAPSDEERGVRGIDLYVNNDREQLAGLVARIDNGDLTVDVARRVPLSQLPDIHTAAAEGSLHGKIVIVPDAA